VLDCQGKTVSIARSKELSVPIARSTLDWTDCVNYVSRREFTPACDDSLAGRQPVRKSCASKLFTLFKNLRTAGMVDGAINPAAAHQSGIGGVDDNIYVLL
jgi:hypothetical protein